MDVLLLAWVMTLAPPAPSAGPPEGRLAGFAAHERGGVIVYSDAPEAVVDDLIERVDATHKAIRKWCGRMDIPLSQPTVRLGVVFFDDRKDFVGYIGATGSGRELLRGYFDAAAHQCVFYNPANDPEILKLRQRVADARRRGDVDDAKLRKLETAIQAYTEKLYAMTIQHEAAHQFFYESGVLPSDTTPEWLGEGLACLFEVPAGCQNYGRLEDLRSCGLVPLRKLLGARSLFDLNHANNVPSHYAQAWSAVHYLAEAHPKQLAGYIRSLSSPAATREHSPPEALEALKGIFGPCAEGLEEDYKAYVSRLLNDTARELAH